MNSDHEPSAPTRRRRRAVAIVAVVVAIVAAGATLWLTSRPQKRIDYGVCGAPVEVEIGIVPAVIRSPIAGAEPAVTELACAIS